MLQRFFCFCGVFRRHHRAIDEAERSDHEIDHASNERGKPYEEPDCLHLSALFRAVLVLLPRQFVVVRCLHPEPLVEIVWVLVLAIPRVVDRPLPVPDFEHEAVVQRLAFHHQAGFGRLVVPVQAVPGFDAHPRHPHHQDKDSHQRGGRADAPVKARARNLLQCRGAQHADDQGHMEKNHDQWSLRVVLALHDASNAHAVGDE
mmetsp:Transcript_94043/g.287722  ORF Transcript_94043/g.287722 Transcript_94043/m.287722 type:complete len:203 (-) Transcript_94043:719-1327(-)